MTTLFLIFFTLGAAIWITMGGEFPRAFARFRMALAAFYIGVAIFALAGG